MAETFHEDMRQHLAEIQSMAKTGIDYTAEIERKGAKYTSAALADLIADVKAACGHSDCTIADEYLGNPRPE